MGMTKKTNRDLGGRVNRRRKKGTRGPEGKRVQVKRESKKTNRKNNCLNTLGPPMAERLEGEAKSEEGPDESFLGKRA